MPVRKIEAQAMSFTLHHGDCLDVLRGMADNSIDSIVTDPPYGLSFMGKKWDYDVPAVDVWAECLRVLKPGGHLLAFAGTRTQHRMAVRIEDAGFEIRDMIAWVYGSGFPKSLDVSKALDKVAGVEREKKRIPYSQNVMQQGIGVKRPWMEAAAKAGYHELQGDEPATEAAAQWQGWGTALKPALEPITVARKPLAGTVSANVLAWGTGALNIDGCRIGTESTRRPTGSNPMNPASGWNQNSMVNMLGGSDSGRWPANLIHDGSDEVLAGFPETLQADQRQRRDTYDSKRSGRCVNGGYVNPVETPVYNDTGSAARFFYCAKASAEDRDAGTTSDNHHPTVKPTDLMRYLVRLVTPPGGTALAPFMGSGSTGKATMLEGFRFVGIEREAEYIAIARARIEYAQAIKASGAEKLQPATARDAHTVDLFA